MCSYVSNGQPMVALSCAAWTWEFNLNTGKWNERESRSSGVSQGRWRARFAINAFDKWLVGDALSGNILQLSASSYKEISEPQVYRVESGPVANFPNRIQVARADFDFVTGVGIATGADPNETDPVVRSPGRTTAGQNGRCPCCASSAARPMRASE